MIEDFLTLVSPTICKRSGAVLYSGRTAFSKQRKLYILGLNPGGSSEQPLATIERHIEKTLKLIPDNWSEYRDESWEGHLPGTYGLQPAVLHLLRILGLDPGEVPSSNIIFVRSSEESFLKQEIPALFPICWPVHQAVIDKLNVKVIICFGKTAGHLVGRTLNANRFVDRYIETNARRWQSTAYCNPSGQCVITVTHPSRADWTNPEADPSSLVRAMLDRF